MNRGFSRVLLVKVHHYTGLHRYHRNAHSAVQTLKLFTRCVRVSIRVQSSKKLQEVLRKIESSVRLHGIYKEKKEVCNIKVLYN